MKTACVNLRKACPGYKITLDESCEDKNDPWYFQIPGKQGTIYPYGEDQLAVEVDGHRNTALELCRLGIDHTQSGDGEHTFVFPVKLFPKVARIVRSYRKRKLSAETLAKTRENLARARGKRKPAKIG